MSKNREHGSPTAAIRSEVPSRPGVYMFRNGRGATIYVGKSVNLRRRMLSYFGSDQTQRENRIRQMAFSIRAFDFRETESELMALLLEDALIKRERPAFNVRQQEYAGYRYIVLTDDPYPTCRVVDHEEAARGAVFGPFRDRYLAADIIDIVNRFYRLRTCTDRHPFRKSMNFDLGFCTGPCRNQVSMEDYAQIVGRVVRFLNGDERWITAKLGKEMAQYSATLDYERAARLKRQLIFSKNFCARQRFIRRFRSEFLTVHEEGDEHLKYQFAKGDLVEVSRLDGTKSGSVPVFDELLESHTDQRFLLDKANLVYGWLKRNKAICQHAFGDGSP